MAAYLKETLLDLADNRIVHHDREHFVRTGASVAWEYLPGWEQQCEVRCDIHQGLEHLLRTDQVDTYDIMCLSRFMSGHTIASNGQEFESLVKILSLLEHTMRYTDDEFLQRVLQRYPKLRKMKDAYRERLLIAGRTFEEI